MNQQSTKAQIIAVTAGDRRHEIFDVEADFSDETCPVKFLKIGSTGRVVEHHFLEMDTPRGHVSVPIPGDVNDLCALIDEAIRCHISAQFVPQAWVNDHALEVDEGRVNFNAVPALIRMDLAAAKVMFASGVFDELADGQEGCKAHCGPFEVRIDSADVVRMVCLLSGYHGALGENDSIEDVTAPMWDDFCIAANGILSVHPQPAAEAVSPHILIDGNVFTFEGSPGQVCAIHTQWAFPFEDDAYRLALTLMESQLLALYSAGVLWSKESGRFEPNVIEAVVTSFNAIPGLIEALDEPADESMKGLARDRSN